MTYDPDIEKMYTEAEAAASQEITEAEAFTLDELLDLYHERLAAKRAAADALDAATRSFDHVALDLIPMHLRAVEAEELTVGCGRHKGTRITLKHAIRASISAERQDTAYAWLVEQGLGGIIKEQVVAFPDGDVSRLLTLFSEANVSYEVARKVHPQTLVRIVRERLEDGKPVSDAITVFDQITASIKTPSA